MSKDQDAVRCPWCHKVLAHEQSYQRHRLRCKKLHIRDVGGMGQAAKPPRKPDFVRDWSEAVRALPVRRAAQPRRKPRRVVPSRFPKTAKASVVDKAAWWYEDRRGIDVLVEDAGGLVHSCRIGWRAIKDALRRCQPDPPKAKR